LKDNFQPASANGLANQLIPIMVGFVSPNLKIREKALDDFLECDPMKRQFIVFKVVFKIGGSKSTPVRHSGSPEQIITHSQNQKVVRVIRAKFFVKFVQTFM